MFEQVFAAITNVVTLQKGSTGYLDEVPWSTVPVKGVDASGRPFFALPLFTTKLDRHGGIDANVYPKEGRGMVTFFKRYSDPDHNVWVSADSHQTNGYADPTIRGKLENPNNGDLEDMMLRVVSGETVEFIYEDKKEPHLWGRFSRTTRLMTPDEVQVAMDALLVKTDKGHLQQTA